ncbi:MAG TPA: hypothetical protein VK727_18195 [Steroidobacteraceae bacterium]|jgi:hypothetical protein|nr:hypothetical protein [Steroidobacteraceae bacterium]
MNRGAKRQALAATLLCVAGVVLMLAFGSHATNAATQADPFEPLAQAFVSLALQLGHSPGHESEVDSYFGAATLVPTAAAPSRTLAELSATAQRLVADISHQQQHLPSTRGARLLDQARTLAALIEELQHPHARSFAAQAWAVYAMRVPAVDPQATRRTLSALAALLPGTGSVADRLDAYRLRFVIAPQRRRAVFERALQECRARTLKHWALPGGERVEVEWSTDVPAAWQRYQGGNRSTLQINAQAVAFAEQALDVACHEAYPGHHSQFVLLTQHAGPTGPPVEDTIALLHSPASVLREGAANFGVELAFPLAARVAFDRNVLFPLAGLDPSQADRYEHVNALVADLAAAAVPILASYQDGSRSFADAAAELRADALVSSPEALLRFVDEEGAYTLGYTAARDSIRNFVRARSACTKEDPWRVLAEVVSVPEVTALSADGSNCTSRADRTG